MPFDHLDCLGDKILLGTRHYVAPTLDDSYFRCNQACFGDSTCGNIGFEEGDLFIISKLKGDNEILNSNDPAVYVYFHDKWLPLTTIGHLIASNANQEIPCPSVKNCSHYRQSLRRLVGNFPTPQEAFAKARTIKVPQDGDLYIGINSRYFYGYYDGEWHEFKVFIEPQGGLTDPLIGAKIFIGPPSLNATQQQKEKGIKIERGDLLLACRDSPVPQHESDVLFAHKTTCNFFKQPPGDSLDALVYTVDP